MPLSICQPTHYLFALETLGGSVFGHVQFYGPCGRVGSLGARLVSWRASDKDILSLIRARRLLLSAAGPLGTFGDRGAWGSRRLRSALVSLLLPLLLSSGATEVDVAMARGAEGGNLAEAGPSGIRLSES